MSEILAGRSFLAVGCFEDLSDIKEELRNERVPEYTEKSKKLIRMKLDRAACLNVWKAEILPYRISGEDRLLLLADRKDLLFDSIEWTGMNNVWEWAILDASKNGVSASFYADVKGKEFLLRSAKRKVFRKSVLELLWVFMKANEPLWECYLEWTDNE